MTYDQLTAFLAVAREGSFTAATAVVHKTQPAISKLVRNLEDELGVELFDRSQYRVRLTDAGRLLHERATSVVESTEALRSFARELAGKVEPIVRLAVEAVTPLAPVVRVLRAVQERYPAVRIELGTERLAGAAAALREDRVEVVIATRVGVEGTPVEVARFASVRIVPVARADHPVVVGGAAGASTGAHGSRGSRGSGGSGQAARGAPRARGSRSAASRVPPALLRAHPQIVLRDSALGEASPSLNVLAGGVRWSVTDIAAKKELILAGMGWGGLPEHVVAPELASGELVALDVPEFEAETMELLVMRRRDRALGVVAGVLWEELGRAGESEGSVERATRSSAADRARRRGR